MNADKKITLVALLMIALYSIISFFIVSDYGINIDEPTAFGLGHKYLDYYQTGHLDFQDELPKIKNHPLFYNAHLRICYFHDWPFTNTLSAITCYFFSQKLNFLDPISAHHIIIPLLVSLLLLLLFLFVKKYWGSAIGLISISSLLTIPRFFGHSFYNTKDIPEIVFFSITIMLFAQWTTSKKIKYLYSSFVFWSFAIGTKMDAILIPIILGLWQLKTIYKYVKMDASIRIKTIFHFITGFFITVILLLSYFPTLQPWFYQDTKDYLINAPKFIHKVMRYVVAIGANPNSYWNLYAPSQIFYTTPIIMLIVFITGLIYILFNMQKNKNLNLLLIIWLSLPILRHCFPGAHHYDGLRHFLIFTVPFSIIVAIGVGYLAQLISKKTSLKYNLTTIAIATLVLLPNIYSIIILHPFQTTYYNSLVGGLKGAQEKNIAFSSDYWMNSARSFVNWINKNAKKNASISMIQYCLLDNYKIRQDIKIIRYIKDNIPNNTYLLWIPRKWGPLSTTPGSIDNIFPDHKKFNIVYQIKRQGGEIMTIYYKP